MARAKTPSFVLTLPLVCDPYEVSVLNKRFSQAEHLYNQVCKHAKTRLFELKRNKKYKRLLREYQELKDLEEKDLKTSKKSKHTKLKTEKSKELKTIQQQFGLSEYQLHEYVKKQYQQFKGIDSNTGQALATRVWKATETNLYGKGKSLHLKKHGQLNSIEGKSNKSGITYKNEWLIFNKLMLKVKIRQTDLYAQEALTSNVKYCRILRKIVRGKTKFYVQLVLEGTPPPKRKKEGSFKHKPVKGRVGLDIGTSSLAVVSNKKCLLTELAAGLENYDKQKRRLQRKLDRSKRANNPNNYNEDGTIKRGIRLEWIRSKRYMKTLFKLKEVERKRAVYRKQSHEKLANEILKLGNEIYIETMNFKALQKRSTKTEMSEKTGKFKRKKRFGKSIGTHAPGAFVEILKRKLAYQGKELHQVNTTIFKASQFNHVTGEYTKKELHDRWNLIKNELIQRDLYSAFLLMNSRDDLTHTDIKRCQRNYKKFKENHDLCLKELEENLTIKKLSCFGLNKKPQRVA